MADKVHSNDTRQEIDSSGATLFETHETDAELQEGLAGWFRVGGKPVAVVGSAGPNQSQDHRQAKKGKTLVPLATRVVVTSGESLMKIGSKDVATSDSEVQVPDVQDPHKTGVLQVEQTFFRVSGKSVARGQ